MRVVETRVMTLHVNATSMMSAVIGASRNLLSNPILLQQVPSKGLLNGPGQNNCFLNCAVQVGHN